MTDCPYIAAERNCRVESPLGPRVNARHDRTCVCRNFRSVCFISPSKIRGNNMAYIGLLLFHYHQVVADGSATLVFLDSSYRPIRLPAEVKQVFTEVANDYKAAAAAAGGTAEQT